MTELRIENEELRMKDDPSPPENIQQRSFTFACRIVRLHEHLSRDHGTTLSLSRQLLRSGTSIGANLEEATAGQSKADFISKCSIALKEARETHYWLRLLAATDLVSLDRLAALISESSEIIAVLTSIIKKSRSQP